MGFYSTRSGKLSLLIRLSWDLHSPSVSLMRIVIISCAGPDNPVNEDDCKMEKKKSPSAPWRVCIAVLITELGNMFSGCHPQAFQLHLILHFCQSLVCPIILHTQADPS